MAQVKPQPKPQDRILDAALSVFRRHGFRRSSIEQAAEAAGLTRQALYHHFSSKEALFRAVVERLYDNALAEEIAAAGAAEERGTNLAAIVLAQIGARFRYLLSSLDGSPHLEELFSEHLAQAKDLYQAYATRYTEEIATTIARVCRSQKLPLTKGMNSRELARCVEMAIAGAKSRHPSMRPLDAFLKDLDTMLRMLIAGAVAQPARQAKSSRRKTETRR